MLLISAVKAAQTHTKRSANAFPLHNFTELEVDIGAEYLAEGCIYFLLSLAKFRQIVVHGVVYNSIDTQP